MNYPVSLNLQITVSLPLKKTNKWCCKTVPSQLIHLKIPQHEVRHLFLVI
jgi:hypothetical protein